MIKWIVLLTLLLLVLSVGTAGVVFATSEGARTAISNRYFPEPKKKVRLSMVTKGAVVRTINAPGSVEPKTKVQISAQVAARITELPFREGDSVLKNAVVARLDSRDLAAAVESAQANLAAEEARLRGAEASLKQSQIDLARAQRLYASKDLAQNALQEAESTALRNTANVEASRQMVAASRSAIVRAQKDLENSVIVAPFDGTLVKLNAEVGELVLVGTLNNAASVIMEIADLNVMLMKARVDEANIAPVRAGQACRVYLNAYQGRDFAGKVERVGLKRLVDRDGTGYFEVEVLVEKPKDLVLGSGLTANVDIKVESFEDVLKVPSQAIVERRFDSLPTEVQESPLVDKTKVFTKIVFVIENGKSVAVPVVAGASDLTDTVILSGLREGQEVISGPFKVLIDLAAGKPVIDEKKAPKEKDSVGKGSGAGHGRDGKGGEKPDDKDEADEEV